MPLLPNLKHEKFCLELLSGKNGYQAVISAGYSTGGAYYTASRLRRDPRIVNRLLELRKEIDSPKIMSIKERKEKLSEIARAKLTDFRDTDGAIILGEGMPSSAISDVKTEVDGDNKTVVTAIKLHSPVQSIAELNKMERVYEVGSSLNIQQNNISIQVVSKKSRELTNAILQGERTN